MAKDKRRKQAPQKRPRISWEFIERLLGLKQIRTAYLYGRPGIGKTWVAYHSGRIGDGVYSITLTEDTPAAELRGFWSPKGGELVWLDGPFTRAMREGARLVINELSHGSPDVLALLYPVLESEETAQLTLPTSETVRPAPGFHVICTDNEPPDLLPLALQDRFDCLLPISEPHPDALARLSDPIRAAALQTFDLEPERAISLRSWMKLDDLEKELGLEDACTAVFGPERGAHIHDAISLASAQGQLL